MGIVGAGASPWLFFPRVLIAFPRTTRKICNLSPDISLREIENKPAADYLRVAVLMSLSCRNNPFSFNCVVLAAAFSPGVQEVVSSSYSQYSEAPKNLDIPML